MRLALDTSAYSALQRGDRRILQKLDGASHVYLPAHVVGELKAGFRFGTKADQNNALLHKFIVSPKVSVLWMSDKTLEMFAELYAQLRTAGTPIGQNDLWIAALCREHDLPLLTLDADFSCVSGLELVKL